MKLMFVTETYLPFIAGVSTSTDSISKYMHESGDNVIVVSPKPVLPDTNKQAEGFRMLYVFSIPDIFCKGKPFSPFPLAFPSIFNRINFFKPDLIHIQEPGAVGWSAIIAAKLMRVKVVGAWHFTPDQTLRFMHIPPYKLLIKLIELFARQFYNLCDAIMVPTQTFADYMKKIGIKPDIIVVSNGVYTDKYFPAQPKNNLKTKLNLPDEKVLFFFLGRVDEDKHIDEIISAMKFVGENAHLIIAGNGNAKNKLHEQAKKINVDNKISWLGFMSEEEMLDAYRSVDCFILMSPYEVQSIVALQALACGLPVILSSGGALPELCQNNINGYLVENGDYKNLAEKIDLLTQNPEIRKRMGQESRKISMNHEKSKALEKLRNFYLNIIKK